MIPKTPFDRGLLALAAALALLVVALPACDRLPWQHEDPAGPSVIVQQTQTVTLGATPAPSPSPTPASGSTACAAVPSEPVTYVRFGLRVGGSCRVEADRGCAVARLDRGSALTLDISPLSGQTLAACHGPLALDLTGTGCELRSGGGENFLPEIAGVSTGDCRLLATVNGTSGVLVIEVR